MAKPTVYQAPKVKRYDFLPIAAGMELFISEMPLGRYVKFEDYAALFMAAQTLRNELIQVHLEISKLENSKRNAQ